MRPIQDLYWIKVEKETEDTITLNGVELYRDTSYDPMKLARQYGVVFKTPSRTTVDVDIQEGDKIWFHHFVATEGNLVKYIDEENIYQANINQVYLVERDGKYLPIGRWNFIEQEEKKPEETSSGIIIESVAKEVSLHGKAVYINEELREQGVTEGNRVLFSENSEYDMDIDGTKLLRMRNFDILAVYEEGK
jgi:co-chaperonin GroES (HSP10)